jgi:catechol 2,3-dioxygenase-like lactoylglutathione lyase family enzyme
VTRRGRPHRRRTVEVVGLDHVQLAMPTGEEALARLFYGGVLGLQEVRKPRQLARRGGAWFVGPGLAVHLGVEEPFRPATKAHPALVVRDLDHARERLAAHGVAIEDDPSGLAVRRCYVADPFGNRIELVDARDAGFTSARVAAPRT